MTDDYLRDRIAQWNTGDALDTRSAGELITALTASLAEVEAAIRTHRDARGDDRCWMDDEALYRVLPEGYEPPTRDTAVELRLCEQFISSRCHPATEYVSPQREIERLEAKVAEVEAERDQLQTKLIETLNDVTRLLDQERRRWYDGLSFLGDIEGLAPEAVGDRIREWVAQ